MAFSLADIKKRAAEAAKTGPDLNIQTSGGGDYQPPAAGVARLRLVGYIETGVHTTKSTKFGNKTKPRATLLFELSGPKHQPKEFEGKKIPHVIAVKEPISQNKKANYSKLFKEMAKDYPGVKNFGELIGESFKGVVVHRKFKRRDGSEGTVAELKGENGYTITGPLYEDPETGEPKKLVADPAISELRLFLWDFADLEMWDSLFIAGTYDDGGSKNKFQEEIKQAENLDGSPIYDLLLEAGRGEELVPAPKPERKEAEADEAQDDSDDGDGEAEAAPEADPLEAQTEAPAQEGVKKAPNRAQEPTSQPAKGVGAGKAENASKARVQKAATNKAAADDSDDPLAGLK